MIITYMAHFVSHFTKLYAFKNNNCILMMCQYGIFKLPILSLHYQIVLSDATNIVVSVLMMSFLMIMTSLMTFTILIIIEKVILIE